MAAATLRGGDARRDVSSVHHLLPFEERHGAGEVPFGGMGVDGCGFQPLVAEQGRHGDEVFGDVEQLRAEAVAQRVRRDVLESRLAVVHRHQVPDRRLGEAPPALPDEEVIVRDARSHGEVDAECVAHIRIEGDGPVLHPLPPPHREAAHAVGDVNVADWGIQRVPSCASSCRREFSVEGGGGARYAMCHRVSPQLVWKLGRIWGS